MKRQTLPGSFYQRNDRWYWRVKLVEDDGYKIYQLKPKGARFATKNEAVAKELAMIIYKEARRNKNPQSLSIKTVGQLVDAYLEFAARKYCKPDGTPKGEVSNIKYATKHLLEQCPNMPVEDFGSVELEDVRETMVEKGLSRNVINQRVGIWKRMYKWAIRRRIVYAAVLTELQTVDGLLHGEFGVKETDPVLPAEREHVYTTMKYANCVLADMIEIHMLTGMRSTELCIMRPMDINRKGDIWLYNVPEHKNTWRGPKYKRIIPLGKRSQVIMAKYILRQPDRFCFSPREAMKAAWLARYNKDTNTSHLSECYDRRTYRAGVTRAIMQAIKADEQIDKWHPHQLRHTAGTLARQKFGKSVAGKVLGDFSDQAIDIYTDPQGEQLEEYIKFAKECG